MFTLGETDFNDNYLLNVLPLCWNSGEQQTRISTLEAESRPTQWLWKGGSYPEHTALKQASA